jgi:hypothetical protein
VSSSRTEEQLRLLKQAFAMPSVQTLMSRKSSITNAGIVSLIPVVQPTLDEIEQALRILGMTPEDVRCAYCGDPNTEWDHLRPLVVKRRPTGYISEIGNLVPSCAKCNQSKRNEHWRTWMMSKVPRSPASRNVPDLTARIARLEAYEAWRPAIAINFEKIVGAEACAAYWQKLDAVIELMRETQGLAEVLRKQIAAAHGATDSRAAVEREVNEEGDI